MFDRIHRQPAGLPSEDSHLLRLLDVKKVLRKVNHDDLQEYIYERMKEHVSPVTVRKEIQTLVTIRNWKMECGLTVKLDYSGGR